MRGENGDGNWEKLPGAASARRSEQRKEEQGRKEGSRGATTVRAVEIIEKHAKAGEWVKVDARTLLGTEQEVETVNPDEFCVPELPKPGDKEEFMAQVERLAEATQLTVAGSRTGTRRSWGGTMERIACGLSSLCQASWMCQS